MTSEKYVPFSVRAGRRSIPQLGLHDMPRELRVSLWNVIEPWIWKTHHSGEYDRRAQWVFNFHAIRWETDRIPPDHRSSETTALLNRWFVTDAPVDDVYDFVEALPQMVLHGMHVVDGDLNELYRRGRDLHAYTVRTIENYRREANAMLEREGSPYRLIEGFLTPITNQEEIDEVHSAIAGRDRFAPAREHIAEGLKHLGTRPPAYADCIKQAVSAIESALKIAVGDESWRMAQLLKGFEEKYGELHPSLKAAIDKIYGYASDEDGVRHGAVEAVSVGEAEARAMLVTCSALTNFLIRKATAKG